jgi:hypothetical protein
VDLVIKNAVQYVPSRNTVQIVVRYPLVTVFTNQHPMCTVTSGVCGTNRGPVCTEGTHRGPLAHMGRDVCAQINKIRLGRPSSRNYRAHIGTVVYHFRVGFRRCLVHIGYPMCYTSVCSASREG